MRSADSSTELRPPGPQPNEPLRNQSAGAEKLTNILTFEVRCRRLLCRLWGGHVAEVHTLARSEASQTAIKLPNPVAAVAPLTIAWPCDTGIRDRHRTGPAVGPLK